MWSQGQVYSFYMDKAIHNRKMVDTALIDGQPFETVTGYQEKAYYYKAKAFEIGAMSEDEFKAWYAARFEQQQPSVVQLSLF